MPILVKKKQYKLPESSHTRFGFSLVELLVVLVIVIILASLAIPSFVKTSTVALDREAKTSLKLIQAAERIYGLRIGVYHPPVGTTAGVNSGLGLNLPTPGNWQYGITVGTATDFTATATTLRNTHRWRINPIIEPEAY